MRTGAKPIGHAWVNRLSWLHYEHYADLIGFEVAHRSFTETPIDEEFYTRFEDVLGRYPTNRPAARLPAAGAAQAGRLTSHRRPVL